jgi:hypothetical protein
MRKFLIPRAVAGQDFASLEKNEHFPANFQPLAGEAVEGWPDDVRLHMDANFPKQILLPDYVKNLHNHLVVSAALKDLVLSMQPQQVQALPITIIDHKGKVASSTHCLLHVFPLIDAIDQQKSDLEWNPIDTTRIMGCEQLVLDDAKIPENVHLFRLKHMPTRPVMSEALVQAIKAANLTGAKFERVEEFEL